MDKGVGKLRCISPGCHLCGESSKRLIVSLGSLKHLVGFSGGKAENVTFPKLATLGFKFLAHICESCFYCSHIMEIKRC